MGAGHLEHGERRAVKMLSRAASPVTRNSLLVPPDDGGTGKDRRTHLEAMKSRL